MIPELIVKLEKRLQELLKGNSAEFEIDGSREFQRKHGMKGNEIYFCPEEEYYNKILTMLDKEDVIYDIGAGDLRFDLMLSQKVKKVYAVEINPTLLAEALKIIGYNLPVNLIVICGNGFQLEIPSDVTVLLCLMIHRKHHFPFEIYERKNLKIISSDFNIGLYCTTAENYSKIIMEVKKYG